MGKKTEGELREVGGGLGGGGAHAPSKDGLPPAGPPRRLVGVKQMIGESGGSDAN